MNPSLIRATHSCSVSESPYNDPNVAIRTIYTPPQKVFKVVVAPLIVVVPLIIAAHLQAEPA